MNASKEKVLAAGDKAKEKALDWYTELGQRERNLIIAGILFIIGMIVYSVGSTLIQDFDRQKRIIAELETSNSQVAGYAGEFGAAKQRLADIEKQFESIKFEGGVRSHLETLLTNTARIEKYKIRPNRPLKLGDAYQLEPFNISFDTTDLASLTNFLKEVIYGPRPLLITRLDIAKSRRTNKLTVTLDVNSVKNAT